MKAALALLAWAIALPARPAGLPSPSPSATPLAADEIVVTARRGPSKELMKQLNAPLQPAPTAFENKIAPAAKAINWGMRITIWTLLALSATGLIHH